MKLYTVSPQEYYDKVGDYLRKLNDPTGTYDFLHAIEQCKEPITQLVQRYNLQSKKILSIAPNFGHEEYTFFTNGCDLTFVDIDEKGYIEPFLKTLAQAVEGLKFYIGDANDFVSTETYDAMFMTSFTLDEFYRHDQMTINPVKGFLRKLFLKLFGVQGFHKHWPKDGQPFTDLTMKLTGNIKDGGVFISQSYAWGVNIKTNRNYIPALLNQLHSNDLLLSDLYYLDNQPTASLVAAYKRKYGSIGAALTTFLGRAGGHSVKAF